jgi:hypothetical protein
MTESRTKVKQTLTVAARAQLVLLVMTEFRMVMRQESIAVDRAHLVVAVDVPM